MNIMPLIPQAEFSHLKAPKCNELEKSEASKFKNYKPDVPLQTVQS
ncbi:hypothetical protein [Thermoanaerobacterium sp. RBIITD]|nr:hypothetical protein [Thermoanaerobacterium sp. RBIITD]